MAQFNMSRGKFEQRDYERLKALLQKSLNEYDFDSGWILAPTPNSVSINLPRTPRYVSVQESNDADGEDWNSLAVLTANKDTVTFTATKTYVRVVADI